MSPYLSPFPSPSSSPPASPITPPPGPFLHITCACTLVNHILPVDPIFSHSRVLSHPLSAPTGFDDLEGRSLPSFCTTWIELSSAAGRTRSSPEAQPPEGLLARLERRDVTRTATEKARAYSCPGCGASVFLERQERWLVGSGLLRAGDLKRRATEVGGERMMEGGEGVAVKRVVELMGEFGPGSFLPGMDGRERRCYSGASGEERRDEMLEKARQRARMRELAGDWKGKVEWGCACGAYRGYLLRSEANKDRFGIWVKNDGGRFTGVLSLGEQARRCSGFEIEVWVVVPWSQIRGDEGAAAWLEDVKMGNREAMDWDNVQMYRPTHGVERYSCKKCGASILWVERKRPGVVKVSAGLLKSAEGVRAEDWITWELSEDQEGADPGVVEELRNALQSWNETMKTALHTQDTK